MNWIDSLKNIAQHGKPGKCPKCGSDNTDYACHVISPEKSNGYMDVWCNDCKRAYHISRMEVTDNMKKGICPKNLIY